jgi:hypothetical protein
MNQVTEINFDGNVAAWIWKNFVPKSGQAGTVQGELSMVRRTVKGVIREAQ